VNLGSRSGPSGPRIELQLPFYGAAGVTGAGTYYVDVGTGRLVPDGPLVEPASGYFIPQRGLLGTFQVANVAVGDDTALVSYRVRRDGTTIATIPIGNNAAGPMRTDLSKIGVSPGSIVSVQVVVPAFTGAFPVPKLVFTWFPSPGQ
jgi:hypothetical protein